MESQLPLPIQTESQGSKLSQLKRSFNELDYEAKLNLILEIRANRRISKRPTTTKSKAKSSTTTTKKRNVSKKGITKGGAKALLNSLTPEQLLELLSEMGGLVEDES